MEDYNVPESGEDCFQPLNLSSGNDKYTIESTEKNFTVHTAVKLPDELRCERCVLRWHYNTGLFIISQTYFFL